MSFATLDYKGARCEFTLPHRLPQACTVMGNRLCTRLGLSPSVLEPKILVVNRNCTTARVPLISVLALMVCFDGVNAVNLQKCGARLQAAQGGALNTTSNTSPAPVLRLSYEECIVECGGGVGDVSWQAFSQSFGTWFLPWIALAFQIPFGAECT
jgi:hypothetical protein